MTDCRGAFIELYKDDVVGEHIKYVQDNLSISHHGVVRGLHFQMQHPQGKLVIVLKGAIFDVAVDLRFSSPSFGAWVGTRLDEDRFNQLYVPPGLAHGFLALEEDTMVLYKCTDYYHPEDEAGIRWDDPTLRIEWPDMGIPTILSDKDMHLPFFDSNRHYFD